MNKASSFLILTAFFVLCEGCTNSNKIQTSAAKEEVLTNKESETKMPNTETRKTIADFVPSDYKIFEEINGDLNKDGIEDSVLIIKGTSNENVITDEYRGKLDRNRRGIVVLFKNKKGYVLVAKNYDCFSSENEDGGIYFPPELSVNIENGKLYIRYGHGRYGYWGYTFRFQNADFELIGYDISNGGAVISNETSINFLTKKKVTKINTNEDAEGGDEVFEEKKEDVKINQLIKLSEIKDFDELEIE